MFIIKPIVINFINDLLLLLNKYLSTNKIQDTPKIHDNITSGINIFISFIIKQHLFYHFKKSKK